MLASSSMMPSGLGGLCPTGDKNHNRKKFALDILDFLRWDKLKLDQARLDKRSAASKVFAGIAGDESTAVIKEVDYAAFHKDLLSVCLELHFL